VYDFRIKCIGHEHLQHLYDALWKETYENFEDVEGDLYCSIALKWNYAKHHVDLAMVKYIMIQLTKYDHVEPLKPQHCPYLPNLISYVEKNTLHLPRSMTVPYDMVQAWVSHFVTPITLP
jgi:hypothetical protein